jgi:hypothetical protein
MSSSGRKHPERMSSRGDSGVLIRTRFVDNVLGVFAGGVGAVGGISDDVGGVMISIGSGFILVLLRVLMMWSGLDLPKTMCLLVVVMPF